MALDIDQQADLDRVFSDGGEMGARMRAIDWSRTPLGPVSGWSQALRTTVGMLLRSRFPMLLWWGPEFVQLYNDAYIPIPGAKHPRALSQPAAECWAEIWDVIGPMVEAPFSGQPATWSDDLFLLLRRKDFLEETHFKVAYSPVPDEGVQPTGIGGVLATVAETTEQVYGERQLRTLRELGARAAEAKSSHQACETAAATFCDNDRDVPFALFYLIEPEHRRARLVSSCGFDAADGPANPSTIDLDQPADAAAWPLARLIDTREIELLGDLGARLPMLPRGQWSEPPHQAIALPLSSQDSPDAYGVLISGCNPHRQLDDGYRTFFELAASQVITAIRNANAFEEQRLRAERLAELDRAKTAFFSNVSHEFRTPLTLMLGPLEDALAAPVPALTGDNLDTAHRNALRLLRLVNALLDFSRIEAGRVEASFRPTDLTALTAELTSVFRSAIERAGLRLVLQLEPLPEPVLIDRTMWEKIVLNLLSNAYKFTFDGEIEVTLRAAGDRAELTVRDTGGGITAADLPRVFERFHRVDGARARTHEGSGIGLALVQELVRIHGGAIDVASELGRGTTFTVSVPFGTAHLPAERIAGTEVEAASMAAPFVAEALRWLPDENTVHPRGERAAEGTAAAPGARILVVDDNADMRSYLARLLGEHWAVDTAADGIAGLAAARRQSYDVVITDVMMPGLDGFGLLRQLRADPATRSTCVIMLSARAGEESMVEGLQASADDYIVKPFSARELVARVSARLELQQARRALEVLALEAHAANQAKDEFLAMLGHELRNPLSPMLTALEVMRLRGATSREQEIIERQVGHLTRLVDDLLDVARITQGKVELQKQPVELAEVVTRAIEIASPLLEYRQNVVDVRVAATGLGVDVDPDRMAQVVANLLTNASKYSEAATPIVVAAERDGDVIRIRVIDRGIGIAAPMLDRVFDMFVQQRQSLDRSRGGLGLGLAIVRSLVDMHGGKVSAHSDGPGTGSEFAVELPARPLAAVGRRPGARDTRPVPVRDGKRILVVDDNGDAAHTLKLGLEQLGYTVAVAHDAPSALRLAESFRPQVALLDIGLPVMDGYELARRLRELGSAAVDLHLVAVTGYGQQADRERSAAAGFARHVVKPVDLSRLQRIVEDLPEPA